MYALDHRYTVVQQFTTFWVKISSSTFLICDSADANNNSQTDHSNEGNISDSKLILSIRFAV